MKFDYKLRPGIELINELYSNVKTLITVILPIVDEYDKIDESIISVLNQSYPNFELLIIGDYKNNYKDNRIKVVKEKISSILEGYNKGIKKSNKDSQFYVFTTVGNLMEKTYLETMYWALLTNENASWAFTNSVIYNSSDETTTLVNNYYNQHLLDCSPYFMIRKEAYNEIGEFTSCDNYAKGISTFFKKAVRQEKVPVHISWYLNWIRVNDYIEYKESPDRIKKIKISYNQLKNGNKPIQYPFFKYNYETIKDEYEAIVPIKNVKNKINILMFVPWIIVGGADIFNLELIKRLDKEKFNVTLLVSEPYQHNLRQKFENICDVYDLTTFISHKDYIAFINYIIKKNCINMIFNTSSFFGYSILPYLKGKYPETPIVDYIHMEEWYNRNGGYSRSSTMVEAVIDQTWICNSVSEEIMHNYFKRKKEEVKTVYIGVDTNRFDPTKYNKEELLKKYKINTDKKIIGFICRISEQKRPLLLADIIDKTISVRDDVLFLIVGDGSMLNELKQRVKKYTNNVKFLPSTNNTPEMYSLCDITLNCSIKEGLALTAYESLSMGVPVISADVGGQRELVGDDVGKLVKCYQEEKDILKFSYTDEEINGYIEAIDYTINNLDTLKNNCRKKILGKFTLDQMGENMSKEFTRVYENPNKEKIENGRNLNKMEGITKELIIASFLEDKEKNIYQSKDFYKKIYKTTMKSNYIDEAYKKGRIKDRLWKSRTWRLLTKTQLWKIAKKIIKRG